MKLKFMKAGEANKAIWQLEARLGLEQGDPIFNISAANKRFFELEKLAGKATPPAPAKFTYTAPPAPPPPPKPKLSRKACQMIMKDVFQDRRFSFEGVSDADLLEDVTARITAAGLVCPALGLVTAGPPLSGMSRFCRGVTQDFLNITIKRITKERI